MMGYEWTQETLYAALENVQELEYLADSLIPWFPEPTWVPAYLTTVAPGRTVLRVRVVPTRSRYADIIGHFTRSVGLDIFGLDQVKNRLRPAVHPHPTLEEDIHRRVEVEEAYRREQKENGH